MGAARTHRQEEELRARIRGAGLKITAPRLEVLAHLDGARAPLTHGEVAEQLARHGWDHATIYRNLMALVRGGLVSRADVGDHVWRFEARRHGAAHEASSHPHFVCDRCGEVHCLPEDTVQLRPEVEALPLAATGKLAIQLRGTCRRCA